MILCQEFLPSIESRERAARLRAEQDEARQREAAVAAEAEAVRLRAEEEARLRAAAEAEAVRLRAEEEARIRAAVEAEGARLRAEEEAQQKAVAEAEAAKYQWLQQRLVDRGVEEITIASQAALLLFKAGITSDRELLELSEADFKEIINDEISKELFGSKAIVLRTKLTTIQQDAKVSM